MTLLVDGKLIYVLVFFEIRIPNGQTGDDLKQYIRFISVILSMKIARLATADSEYVLSEIRACAGDSYGVGKRHSLLAARTR